MTIGKDSPPLRWAWTGAIVCFLIAGSTGALLRFGMLAGYPAGLQMGNIRHAHSHLMYFGWVTPALMALIAARLPELTGRPRSDKIGRIIGLTLTTALVAYVPFLFYGYRPVNLTGRDLPLSMIGAGLNILAWYGFLFFYWKSTRGAARHLPLRLWDAALGFLVLASGGAWGLALLTSLGIESTIWPLALTHLFLDLFADGWFVLALLGLAFSAHPVAARRPSARWGEGLLIVGLPLTLLLSLPPSLLPPGTRILAGAAGLLSALGLGASICALWPAVLPRQNAMWWMPLTFLLLKAATGAVISVPAGARWAGQMALRVSYLHWLLLGFVTLGLVAAAADRWGRAAVPAWRWFTAAVIILLLSLIPLTRLWPAGWSGRWALEVAAWATLGPVLVAAAMLVTGYARSAGRLASRSGEEPVLEQAG